VSRRCLATFSPAWVAVVATVLMVMSAAPAAAFAYKDTGYDPDDRPIDKTSCRQQDPDIRSTTRKVWTDQRGRVWLSVTLRTFDLFTGYWIVIARLDARGGPLKESRLVMDDPGDNAPGCFWQRMSNHHHHRGNYSTVMYGKRATCRVPLRWLRSNKHIRWKLFSPKRLEGTGGLRKVEYAPDRRAWYPTEKRAR
jgi:hypothetical protein